MTRPTDDDTVTPHQKRRELTQAEQMRLLEACSHPKFKRRSDNLRYLITGLLHTGLRITEFINLRWSDILWEDEKINALNLKQYHRTRDERTGKFIRMKSGRFLRVKTTGSDRKMLPLSPTLKELLQRRRTAHEGHSNQRILDISRFRAYRWVRRVGAVCSPPIHIMPHMLRNTFGYNLDDRNVSPTTIRDLMGHTSLHTTDKYLRRRANKAVDEARKAMKWSEHG